VQGRTGETGGLNLRDDTGLSAGRGDGRSGPGRSHMMNFPRHPERSHAQRGAVEGPSLDNKGHFCRSKVPPRGPSALVGMTEIFVPNSICDRPAVGPTTPRRSPGTNWRQASYHAKREEHREPLVIAGGRRPGQNGAAITTLE
jgi:hypothetical protein